MPNLWELQPVRRCGSAVFMRGLAADRLANADRRANQRIDGFELIIGDCRLSAVDGADMIW